MATRLDGIDCDIHPAVGGTKDLLPYLEPYWRDMLQMRTAGQLDLASYPPGVPLTSRPDWRTESGRAGLTLERVQREALDGFGSRYAICNCLYGASACYNDDMAAALCRGINDWMAKEWLDRDPRLRASIVIPTENPELAAEEIERVAPDKRFVQVMVLNMGEMPLGRRHYWPIYKAAERFGLPVGIHAGSTYRHAPTSIGWPSYYIEDYVAQSQTFGAQVASLVTEGVFGKFPGLKVVLIESGFTWLPSFMWRLDKTWQALRVEVPWVTRFPFDIVREHVRMTLQPVDGPPDPKAVLRVIEQMDSDEMLLFSTDYPHWQFDGDEVLPAGLPESLRRKILVENPLATYSRLEESAQ